MRTIGVLGGGAAGMMAALTAAEKQENRVVLLERQQRVGRKLQATGNGRCNLTNTGANIENYHGENRDFALPALCRFSPADTLAFFRELGLLTVEEYGGRVYPLSNSANSVVDVLRFALEQRGVEVHTGCPVRRISRCDGGFAVECEEERFFFDRLIVACGGAAGEKLGGVMDGYELLKPLGHKRTGLTPSLVQLLTAPEYPRALKGIRADAGVSFRQGGACLAGSRGEVQFTETGLSGPAVFDISRTVALNGGRGTVELDFLRDYEEETVKSLLLARRQQLPALPCGELFTGMLHNRLGRMCVKYAALPAADPIGTLGEAALARAARAAKHFALELRGTEGFASAQVTAGGIRTAGFDPETLESWFVPGLFVCGELLDIDGDCGGFNLQWAWASGRLAGRLGE